MKQIDIASVKLGSDAEVFLMDRTGRPFPACGIIKGTKEKPHILSEDGENAVQVDNVMLEFNTGVASTPKEWVTKLQRAMDLAYKEIPPTMYPDVSATQRFHPALLESPEAQTFGCEPDFNAWTMEQNPRPIPEDPTMRTAAAHVHISWNDPADMMQRCRVIQMADIFVTLPSIWESKDRERRKLYGKAGAFRPKKYGAEHRVMDNYWLDRNYLESIWYRYQDAIAAANTPFEISAKLAEKVQDIVNNYKEADAQQLYGEMCLTLLPDNQSKKKKLSAGKAWYSLGLETTQAWENVILNDIHDADAEQ